MMLFAVTDKWNTWWTSVWMVGLGALAGLILLGVVWFLIYVVSRRAGRALPELIQEGPLLPIFWTVLFAAAFGVVGFFLVSNPDEILASIPRVPLTGTFTRSIKIPAAPAAEEPQPIPYTVDFLPNEIRTIEIESDQNLSVVSAVQLAGEPIINWNVPAEEPFSWDRGLIVDNPFEREDLTELLLSNQSEQEAHVVVRTFTRAIAPANSDRADHSRRHPDRILSLFILRVVISQNRSHCFGDSQIRAGTALILGLVVVGIGADYVVRLHPVPHVW